MPRGTDSRHRRRNWRLPGGVRLSDRGDTLMRISYDHDIDAFNQYVEDLVNSLIARGEESTDILASLFLSYKACVDNQFVKCQCNTCWLSQKS